MTKKEIIQHVRDKVAFTNHVANFKEDLKNANELLCEKLLTHCDHSCDMPFKTNYPSLDFNVDRFFLVDGGDYTEYQL
jgi:hypothetical protein